MTIAASLRRLGRVVNEHDRAVAAAGDLAEQGRDRLDLLVGVLVNLVGLDERIDDEQSDAVRADMLDAGIDVGQSDDVPGAVGLGDEQRAIGAAVECEASRISSRGMFQRCRTAASRRFSSSLSSSLL